MCVHEVRTCLHITLFVFEVKHGAEATRNFIEREEDRLRETSMDVEKGSQEARHPTQGDEG